MRFLLTLHPQQLPARIPLDYAPLLSTWVYRRLQRIDPAYAHFLHEDGYGEGKDATGFKFFTYSRLLPPPVRYTTEGAPIPWRKP